ncbi:hypothetical protein ACCO45_006656 [Purpureocillium lilacinum]|uniref:Uncharacterized protein n=1 Tax=Purpureocillium lilacinum TaxID=33203 RepID=A0ACC4DRK2_PURLI
MAFWSQLPRELQLQIFEELIYDRERRPEHHVLAKCASVCRSWQDEFEPEVFKKLCLSQSCLPKFRSIVGGTKKYRLEYIRHLWLRVRLNKYNCKVCQKAEDAKTIRKNCITFTNAVWNLLKILSTWDSEQEPQTSRGIPYGLELEMSVHSPSDNEHVFRPLCLADYCPYTNWHNLIRDDAEIEKDIACGASCKALYRTAVDVQGFSPRVLFRLLHESFAEITELRLEKWMELYADQQTEYRQEFQRLLHVHGLPKSLNELYLVEESSTALHPSDTSSGRSALGFQLARHSRGLEKLSISWNTDAAGFFQEYFRDRWDAASPISRARAPWADLTALTLTCSKLQPGDSSVRKPQRELLRAACVAARLMPRLELLEIWNCGDDSAALFEFDMREDKSKPPVITWMTTWQSRFTAKDRVFECWRKLARERDPEGREPDVNVFTIALPSEERQSKWGLRLFLSEQILHLKSSEQITWEKESTEA